MIEWEYYSRRRNVNLFSFIKQWDIENFEQLVQILSKKGVKPPPVGEFDIAHKVAMPPISPVKPVAKPKPAPETKPKTTRRRGRPRKTKTKG